MPFSLANAPAILQKTIDRIFHSLIGECMDHLREVGPEGKPGKCMISPKKV